MRWTIFATGLALAACSESTATGPQTPVLPPMNGASQAFFPQYPSNLFFAAAAICDGPGQSVVQPSDNEVRCESLPDPESAAAIILQFNGTVESLPKFVISFFGQNTVDGYLVTADHYIRVPQRSGAAQQVRFPDIGLTQDMENLLKAAGGRPR